MRGRSSEIASFGPFRFIAGDGLTRDGADVPLPPRALAILDALVQRHGEVVSKADLLDAGWRETFVTEASLLEAIRVLRAALGDDRRHPLYIQTVHRRGYRFLTPVSWEDRPISGPHPSSGRHAASGIDSAPAGRWAARWAIQAAFAVASVGAVVIAATLAVSGVPTGVAPTSRFSIALPETIWLDALHGAVAASPDGRRFAFVATREGTPHLFIRAADQHAPVLVAGTENASHPFFSPDGASVGFFADGHLRVVDLIDGIPRALARATAGAGATWEPEGTIVFGGGPGGGLARVAAYGGDPTPVIEPRAQTPEVRFGWPDVLPASKGVIFTVVTPAGADVVILDPGASRYRMLVGDAAFGRYSPTGHLIVERDGQLSALPFSIDHGIVTGEPRPVVANVASAGVIDGPRFAFSRSGSLVYVPGPASRHPSLRWVRRLTEGDEDPASTLMLDPASPADARLVSRTPDTAMATGERAVSPTWRPDGLAMAFALNKTGPFNLFVRTEANDPEPLNQSPWNQTPTSWSPDASRLAFTEFHPRTGADIWIMDVATRLRRPFVRTPFDETGARYSPDGRWIAYLTNEAGRWDAVIRSALDGNLRARIPAARLVPDGRALSSSGRELRVVLAWFAELTRVMREPA